MGVAQQDDQLRVRSGAFDLLGRANYQPGIVAVANSVDRAFDPGPVIKFDSDETALSEQCGTVVRVLLAGGYEPQPSSKDA